MSVGLDVGESTLRRYCKQWGVTKTINTPVTLTDELLAQIEDLFLHTLLSDVQIAQAITDNKGPQLSARKIKEIRHQHGLIRRVNKDDPQKSIVRSEATQAAVSHLITEGGGRSFGSRWAQVHLHRRLGHHARLSDI